LSLVRYRETTSRPGYFKKKTLEKGIGHSISLPPILKGQHGEWNGLERAKGGNVDGEPINKNGLGAGMVFAPREPGLQIYALGEDCQAMGIATRETHSTSGVEETEGL